MTGQTWDPWGWDDERRCTAKSRRSGERCRRPAILGGTVCASHGGRAPAVKAAARRRVARERLTGEVGHLLEDFEADAEQAHPVELLLDAVRRSHALARYWGEVASSLSGPSGVNHKTWTPAVSDANAGQVYGPDHLGDQRLHIAMGEYRDCLKMAAQLSKLALDAGVEERQVRLAESTGQELVAVLRTVERLVLARVSGLVGDQDMVVLRADMPALIRQAIESAVPGAGSGLVVDVVAVEP